jgi:catechol 2,3-dioxygenase-like lactoylglutathione lyase family enzyme
MRITSIRSIRNLAVAVSAIVLLAASSVRAQDAAAPQRPKITGISHVGYFVSDLPGAIAFWHDFLGFDEAYDLKKVGSDTDVRIAFIKINDHQHIELFNEPPTAPPDMMSHLCFAVDNVEQMRTYLRSKGFNVKPGSGKTRTGDYAFEIKDPDGMLVEFVQSLPTGLEMQAALPSTMMCSASPRRGAAGRTPTN